MTDLTFKEQIMIWAVIATAIIGLLYAWFLRNQILREDTGTPEMQRVWNAIRVGADAYLKRQLKVVLPFIAVLTVLMFLSVYVVAPSADSMLHFQKINPDFYTEERVTLIVAFGRAIAFVMGAVFSLIVGQLGMRMAVMANVRVASEARRSFGGALRISYRAGTITGMLTDGLGLFGGTIIFVIFGIAAPDALKGFGFGATLLALFMRVGGGIYTKAADVGADLVGKVEQNLEEDDKRNAAVVADLVGDNVGDCAGMSADIFESYEVTLVSALLLGLAIAALTSEVLAGGAGASHLQWIVFPLVVRGIGVFASIFGTYLVKADKPTAKAAMAAINKGFYSSAALSIVLFIVLTIYYMRTPDGGVEWRPFFSVVAGVILAILIDEITKIYTDNHYKPVKDIVRATGGGPATTILSGMAVGKESSVWAILIIAATIASSVFIWHGAYVPNPPLAAEGWLGAALTQQTLFIMYGVAMTGIGMLTLTGNNVAMDSFGPIADNANGVAEMAGIEDKQTRQTLADLDAVGNTTKAITKGVAIGSAVIAAVSLFGSYLVGVSRVQAGVGMEENLLKDIGIQVSNPIVFIGLLIGGALPWLFSAISIKAVERAAGLIVNEVRRQFKDPDIMSYKKEPDYATAVNISTAAAQRELLTLAVICVSAPVAVGFAMGVEALGGFLAGVILSGQLLAVYMSNAGGAWDNAKKTVEDEPRDLALNTGKGSDRHKAGVVGDTVGDPLKDTAGPALNPMIKVINLIAVIVAPVVVQFKDNQVVLVSVTLVLTLLMAYFIRLSKLDVAEAKTF